MTYLMLQPRARLQSESGFHDFAAFFWPRSGEIKESSANFLMALAQDWLTLATSLGKLSSVT